MIFVMCNIEAGFYRIRVIKVFTQTLHTFIFFRAFLQEKLNQYESNTFYFFNHTINFLY